MMTGVAAGTKIDLREDKEVIGQLSNAGLSLVKREQGLKMASKIRAVKYLECSALTQRGLKQVCAYEHRVCFLTKLIVHHVTLA